MDKLTLEDVFEITMMFGIGLLLIQLVMIFVVRALEKELEAMKERLYDAERRMMRRLDEHKRENGHWYQTSTLPTEKGITEEEYIRGRRTLL